MFVEAWSHFMLAINRFSALMLPNLYRMHFKKKAGEHSNLDIPVLFNFPAGSRFNTRARLCIMTYEKVLAAVGGAIGTYFPLVAALILCSICGIHVICLTHFLTHKRSGAQKENKEDTAYKMLKRRIEITRVLLVVGVFHCLCFLPHGIIFSMGLDITRPSITVFSRTSVILGYSAGPVSASNYVRLKVI